MSCQNPGCRANLKMYLKCIYAMNPSTELGDQSLLTPLRSVIDPEVGANIVDMGLIYALERSENCVRVNMTLTSPACPMGQMLVEEVEWALREVLPEQVEIQIELVWDPPWTPQLMSSALQQQFGWTADSSGETP